MFKVIALILILTAIYIMRTFENSSWAGLLVAFAICFCAYENKIKEKLSNKTKK
jgi:thiaminase